MSTKPTYEELEKRVRELESSAANPTNITTFLKEIERIYKHCFEDANIGICVVEPDGNFIMVNTQMVEIFGYSKEEFESMNVDDVSHPEDIEISKNVQRRVKDGEIENAVFQKRYIHKNGNMFWGKVSNSIVKDPDGKPLYFVTHFVDITESKKTLEELQKYQDELESLVNERTKELFQANDALKVSEKNLKNLLNSIQAGVVVHNVEKERIVQFNPAAKKLLGLNDDQILGRSTAKPEWEFVHEDGSPMLIDEYPVNIVKQSRQPLQDYIVGISKPAENLTRWAVVNATPQFSKAGNLSEVIISSMDISELKKTQLRLKDKTEQLMQAQKMESIGTLAGGIAHDFNNILSSILGFTQLALDQVEKNTGIEDDLHEVLNAGNRAKDLVNQILAFARKSEEESKPMQPSIIAKEVLKFIRSSVPTSIDIRQNINSDSFIMASPTQIHQILMNLITNAAHAMEDLGGLLEVSINDISAHSVLEKETIGLKQGDYVQIRVSDTGTGISDEIITSIFEPYFTTKGIGEGTGLGLSVVHGIVETYGGKIGVASRLGEGSTFTIYLPITKKRQLDHFYKAEDLPTGSERILYVDDEASIANMGRRTLEQLGYSAVTRTSSIEALELFRAKPDDFDLVITDMTMPNMTGDVLASELMGIRPDIPVILCTGFSKKISDESAAEIGIKACVSKPFVKADLAKTVRKVLVEARVASQG